MRAHLFHCHLNDLTPILDVLDSAYFKGGLQLAEQRLLVPMPLQPGFGPHNQIADQLRQLAGHRRIGIYPVLIPPFESGSTYPGPTQQSGSTLWIRARTDSDFALISSSETVIWEGIQFEITTKRQSQWAGICLAENGQKDQNKDQGARWTFKEPEELDIIF